jgi:hypothetical protein
MFHQLIMEAADERGAPELDILSAYAKGGARCGPALLLLLLHPSVGAYGDDPALPRCRRHGLCNGVAFL